MVVVPLSLLARTDVMPCGPRASVNLALNVAVIPYSPSPPWVAG